MAGLSEAATPPAPGPGESSETVVPEFQPAPAAEESRPLELLTALGMLAFSVVVLVATQGIESRVDSGGVTPRWWPTILASTMLVLSLVLLVGALRTGVSRGDLKAPTRTGWIRAGGAIVLSAAFLFAWSVVPFVIACAVYIACLVALFGGRSVVSLVVVPVGITAGIYLVFDLLLRVPL